MVRIKICGITREEDGAMAARLGADAIGLNFYPGSSRYVGDDRARAIARRLPPFVEPVALFVNDPLDQVAARVRQLGFIRSVQWHGDRHELPPDLPLAFIPAFQVSDAIRLAEVAAYLDRCRQAGRLPAAVLIDGRKAGQYGGTGQVAPWDLLSEFHPEVPIILAGGLTPENVAEAVRRVHPYGVDVAGGVESSPGIKDADKVRHFIEQAREAAESLV
jgi:phosphoribosylanthranilate isomerase